jgi:uncharacterized membrane protein HdeD (DUF308 family)
MRRYRKCGGTAMVIIGILILASLILPAVCWWLVLGLALIIGGISLKNKKY